MADANDCFADDQFEALASPVEAIRAGIAGVNTGNDLSVSAFGMMSPIVDMEKRDSIRDYPYSSTLTWMQNRTGADGAGGVQVVAISAPALLDPRLHGEGVRVIPASRWIENAHSVVIDTWSEAKQAMR